MQVCGAVSAVEGVIVVEVGDIVEDEFIWRTSTMRMTWGVL